ncbi:MAG: hypothetical protein PVI88_02125 [Nitrosopumilaceae archaeon]|jgi:hypothetical protein
MKVLFLLFLIPFALGAQQVFAEIQGMSLTVEASEGSEHILISGQAASEITEITLSAISPDGSNRLTVTQISPGADGNYSSIFRINSLWNQNGMYTISAMPNLEKNSSYPFSVQVEVINGTAVETLVTESNLEILPDPPEEKPRPKEGQLIPDWVKNTMKWFVEGQISEKEMISALEFLIKEGIIRV